MQICDVHREHTAFTLLVGTSHVVNSVVFCLADIIVLFSRIRVKRVGDCYLLDCFGRFVSSVTGLLPSALSPIALLLFLPFLELPLPFLAVEELFDLWE